MNVGKRRERRKERALPSDRVVRQGGVVRGGVALIAHGEPG